MIGTKVKHKKLGIGTVSALDADRITVDFPDRPYIFTYPDIFESLLTVENPKMQNELLAAIKSKKDEAAKVKAEQEKAHAFTAPPSTPSVKHSEASRKKPPTHKNLIIKCNYCDGGATDERIGYNGICSKQTMIYNVQINKRPWCSNDRCPCNQYLKGWRTYEDITKDGGFLCYENQLLNEWTAYMGWNAAGDTPMKLPAAARTNSLAVLTTREPYTKEDERIVFAVFLVDYHEEGTDDSAGLVRAHHRYRVSLTPDESRTVLLWDYYANPNSPLSMRWGTGLTRLLDDDNAAALLGDIVKLKRGKKDEALAQELYDHFCALNNIDTSSPPGASGALRLVRR